MAARLCCGAILLLALGLAACAGNFARFEGATIQDLMVREVNPAAMIVWGATGYESTASGTGDLAPKSDAEWARVGRAVERLIATGEALAMPSRRVAGEGAILADAATPGNLKAPDIQTGIDADSDGFIGRAWGLRDAGRFALQAVRERDVEKLAEAGEVVNDACSACHDAYWFPNSIQPIP